MWQTPKYKELCSFEDLLGLLELLQLSQRAWARSDRVHVMYFYQSYRFGLPKTGHVRPQLGKNDGPRFSLKNFTSFFKILRHMQVRSVSRRWPYTRNANRTPFPCRAFALHWVGN